MLEIIDNLDTKLFLFLNSINSPFWDTVMWQISTRFLWVPMYATIAFFIIRKYHWGGVWILIGVALVVTAADQSSVHLFKNVFQRLRPCHNPEISDQINLVRGWCKGRYGFVSSHAANVFAVAAYLVNVFKNRPFQVFIMFWAALVSYSRIYVGVHYPADIIVGAMLGLVCGYSVWGLVWLANWRFRILERRT